MLRSGYLRMMGYRTRAVDTTFLSVMQTQTALAGKFPRISSGYCQDLLPLCVKLAQQIRHEGEEEGEDGGEGSHHNGDERLPASRPKFIISW